jgi:hypothetical protein
MGSHTTVKIGPSYQTVLVQILANDGQIARPDNVPLRVYRKKKDQIRRCVVVANPVWNGPGKEPEPSKELVEVGKRDGWFSHDVAPP